MFKSPMQIGRRKRDYSRVLKTGIEGIDKLIYGLDLGQTSIMSGGNASGKSTFLNQIALEVRKQNKKIALYSGELSNHRLMEWIYYTCGWSHADMNKYGFFDVSDKVAKAIAKWLDRHLYIYDNSSMKFENIIAHLEHCVNVLGVEFIILDNLMSLDTRSVQGDKYEKQSHVFEKVVKFSQDNNVHVIFVCHPTKTKSFIRKEDILGSSDLMNAADNIFIMHRNNRDFGIRVREYLRIPEDHILFDSDNVLEICKNREMGIVDKFIRLKYIDPNRFMSIPKDIEKDNIPRRLIDEYQYIQWLKYME